MININIEYLDVLLALW